MFILQKKGGGWFGGVWCPREQLAPLSLFQERDSVCLISARGQEIESPTQKTSDNKEIYELLGPEEQKEPGGLCCCFALLACVSK